MVHKSRNSFSSCSAGFPWRFSGLLPVAWLLRFLVNCLALCSALPFVPAPCGSCCPGTCRVPLARWLVAPKQQICGRPVCRLNGKEAAGYTKPKGAELIYASQQKSSFSPASFGRQNQYIEMVGLLTLERFLGATSPKELQAADRQTDRWASADREDRLQRD